MALTKTPEEVFRGSPPSDAYQPETADAQLLAEEMIADSAQLDDDVAFTGVFLADATGHNIGTGMIGAVLAAGTDGTEAGFVASRGGNDGNGEFFRVGKTRGADGVTYNVILQDADQVGGLRGYGCDGAVAILGGEIGFYVEGSPALNNVPMELRIKLRNAAGTLTEHLWLSPEGALGIGNRAAAGVVLDVSADNIRIRTAKTPASAGATGIQGQIAWDANFFYVCTATDTWKRVAIATW